MDHDGLRIGESGPRLISVAEAAAILRVEMQAVRDWIADGVISHVTLPSGEERIQLSYEHHEQSPGWSTGLVALDLGSGISAQARRRFEQDLPRRRRQFELKGLTWTDVDVEPLCRALAERLLEQTSDEISEITADPWPATAGMFPAGFPPAHVHVVDGKLRMSHGEAATPLLERGPIAIAEVLRRGS